MAGSRKIVEQRTRSIVDLHDDPQTRVLFLTDAGGVGLDLQVRRALVSTWSRFDQAASFFELIEEIIDQEPVRISAAASVSEDVEEDDPAPTMVSKLSATSTRSRASTLPAQ